MFVQRAASSPDAVAVVHGSQHISCDCLRRVSHALAAMLIEHGAADNALVGICATRSIEMITGLLAIIEAGCAYLPLDPDYPPDRLRFMIHDSRTRFILTADTSRRCIAATAAANGATLLPIRGSQPSQRITPRFDDGAPFSMSIAYCIYTSGSSGKPKGVLISHQSICNYLQWIATTYSFGSNDRMIQITPCSFDASVWELFAGFVNGSALVIADNDEQTNMATLTATIRRSAITILQVVPTQLTMLTNTDSLHRCTTLRRVFSGGEPLTPGTATAFLKQMSQCGLTNLYGPTEVTIDATAHDCIRGATYEGGTVPIGLPLLHTQAYVVDENLALAEAGAAGEILVGGIQLASGYLQRPALTAERFIPDPFSGAVGHRLYRTGDKGKQNEHSEFEYIQRLDHQVKIRGFRIELGEIEMCLTSHPNIREAVATPHEFSVNDTRLIAYIVCDPRNVPEIFYVKSYLQERLPHFMIPAAFIILESFPVTPNGKIDRRRLPAPRTIAATAEAANEEDGNAEETKITRWRKTYDMVYRHLTTNDDPTLNTLGWNSSFTGAPIPAEEMQNWVNHTVDRILEKKPAVAVEIGCGTGMLVFRIAPHCRRYLAFDFADGVVQHLKQRLRASNGDFAHVECHCRAAHEFLDLVDEPADTLVINSVTQFFPDSDYLDNVISTSVQCVRPGGRIVVGDIRSYEWAAYFHTAVQCFQAEPMLPVEQLRYRIQRTTAMDRELVISPAYFRTLPDRVAGISHVEIFPKQGRDNNEMVRYRYDVIIHVGSRPAKIAGIVDRDWTSLPKTVAAVIDYLVSDEPPALIVRDIPNIRMQEDIRTMALIKEALPLQHVAAIRTAVVATTGDDTPHPDDFALIGATAPYAVRQYVSLRGNPGCFDLFLVRKSADTPLQAAVAMICAETPSAPPPYTNSPFQRRAAQKRVDHMGLKTYTAPRGRQESLLAGLWAELLLLDKVGIHDNFFVLGGHSVMLVTLIGKIREMFGTSLSVTTVRTSPTIAEIAPIIATRQRERRARDEATLHGLLDAIEDLNE